MKKERYLKNGLSRESTIELLALLKTGSNKTWTQLEVLLGMGINNANLANGGKENGGSEPGKIIEMYRSGARNLQPDKAAIAIQLGQGKGWISSIAYHKFSLELFENSFSNEYIQFERKLFKNMERQGQKILQTMWQHPDLNYQLMWQAIDKVLSPMLKRLLVEGYEGNKIVREESFCAVLGDSLIPGYSQNYVTPEKRFEKFLDSNCY